MPVRTSDLAGSPSGSGQGGGESSEDQPLRPTGYQERNRSPVPYRTTSPNPPRTIVAAGGFSAGGTARIRRKCLTRNDHSPIGGIPAVASIANRLSPDALPT